MRPPPCGLVSLPCLSLGRVPVLLGDECKRVEILGILVCGCGVELPVIVLFFVAVIKGRK